MSNCAFSLTLLLVFILFLLFFSFLLDVCTLMSERKGVGHGGWEGAGSLGRGNFNQCIIF